jgi:hypothetical protein
VIFTDCIGSCKSNYHTCTATKAPCTLCYTNQVSDAANPSTIIESLYQARKMSGQVYMCARGVEVAPIVKIIREYGIIMMVSWLVLSFH